MDNPTIQTAMSELLGALGFGKMAEAVKAEADLDRLRKYARVIVNNLTGEKRADAMRLFRLHRPNLI